MFPGRYLWRARALACFLAENGIQTCQRKELRMRPYSTMPREQPAFMPRTSALWLTRVLFEGHDMLNDHQGERDFLKTSLL